MAHVPIVPNPSTTDAHTTLFADFRRWARDQKQSALNSTSMIPAGSNKSFPAATEQDIFAELGLAYLEPYERCC